MDLLYLFAPGVYVCVHCKFELLLVNCEVSEDGYIIYTFANVDNDDLENATTVDASDDFWPVETDDDVTRKFAMADNNFRNIKALNNPPWRDHQ